MTKLTNTQMRAVLAITDAIVEAVKAAGTLGAPGGTIYAALMAHGITLAQYEQLMAALVGAGKLTKQGHLYFVA